MLPVDVRWTSADGRTIDFLLRCPTSGFGDKAPCHLSTAATRSPPSSRHRRQSARSPVAVPVKIFGLTLILDFIDRCHSLSSLYLPLAALASLPLSVKICNANTRASTERSGLFCIKKTPGYAGEFKKAYGYTARHKNSFWCTITLRSGNCAEPPKGGQSKVIDRLSIP